MENEKQPLDPLKNDEITEKCEKCEMHTEGPGIWRKNFINETARNEIYTPSLHDAHPN